MGSSVATAPPRATPRAVAAATIVVATVLVLLVAAAVTGRAEPQGVNRPALHRDPIGGSCWPLPTERHFDFAYQVRGDDRKVRDGERRRVLTLQYDQVDAADVRADVDDLLTSAGFSSTAPGRLVKTGYGTVRFEVSQLPDLTDDSIVRGVLVLDLPAAAARDEAHRCGQGERAG